MSEARTIPENIKIVDWAGSEANYRWIDYLSLSKKFSRIVEELEPDVIHAGPIQTVAIIPALSGKGPLVSMSWGFDMLEDARRNLFLRLITRFVLNHSDWLIADCDTVRKEAQSYAFPTDHVSVFPWGVDLTLFQPADTAKAKKDLGLDDRFTIVHTRAWAPRYGVDVMLAGFRLAVEDHPELHLVMLGGGSQAEEVKRFRQANQLKKNISLAGYQQNENLVRYYQAGDAYISASHVDGSSVALLEALACGTPAIVSDIPSNLEWVSHEKNGWIFRDGDPQSLAAAISQAIRSKGELEDYRQAARQKAESNADWNNSVQKLLKTYDQAALVGERR